MRPKIILFGDSITEQAFDNGGWGTSLANHFSRTKRWKTASILFITPPPIDEAGRLLHPYIENPSGLPERTNEVAGAYAQGCVDIAGECATPIVDIWTKMQEYTDWKKSCLSDGLHLTQGGNRIVFEEVLGKLKEVGVSLEKLPVDLPLFSDINPKDPLKAFES